jgi:hypothetical protein
MNKHLNFKTQNWIGMFSHQLCVMNFELDSKLKIHNLKLNSEIE